MYLSVLPLNKQVTISASVKVHKQQNKLECISATDK